MKGTLNFPQTLLLRYSDSNAIFFSCKLPIDYRILNYGSVSRPHKPSHSKHGRTRTLHRSMHIELDRRMQKKIQVLEKMSLNCQFMLGESERNVIMVDF